MWCSRAGECGQGSGSAAVDRDGVSGCGAVELASRSKVAAMDPLTEMASRRRHLICRQRQFQWVWFRRAGECGQGSNSGRADRDGVSGCGAVELASWLKVAVVDPSTETAPRRRQFICRQRWCQWVWCSRAGESVEGGSGSVDRDGVKAAAIDQSTETVSVGVVQSSWRAWPRQQQW